MLRVFEAFAGVGSQRMALNNIGVEHEVVGIAEIDKFAIQSYEAIHGETLNVGDISEVALEDIPDHDLFTYSFPCQDISMAGKQGGLDEGSNTRSSLLWECKRVIEGKKPKYLLLENVKNLVGKRHKHNFELWLEKLEGLGYTNYWQVLNAKDYGIPQNRERVFVVSILGEHEHYEFPEKMELAKRLKDVLEDEVDEKFYLSESNLQKLTWRDDIPTRDIKVMAHRKGYNDNMKVHHTSGINSALTTMGGGGREPHVMLNGQDDQQPSVLIKNGTKRGYLEATDGDGVDLAFPSSDTRRGRVQKDKSQTLDTSDSKGVVVFNNDESTLYFYAKDNVLIDNVTLKSKFNNQLPFEPDYVYVDPYVIKNGEDILIINESMGQGEKIKQKEEIWVSEEVIHDTDYLDKLVNDATPKKEYGRMGRQAVETYNELKPSHGETLNPFNKKQSSKDGVSPTLTTRPEGFKTAISVSDNFRIRKLTPKECWRLMGFSDEDFHKAEEVCSNSQLYKQAGNSIVVDVLEGIFSQLFKEG